MGGRGAQLSSVQDAPSLKLHCEPDPLLNVNAVVAGFAVLVCGGNSTKRVFGPPSLLLLPWELD